MLHLVLLLSLILTSTSPWLLPATKDHASPESSVDIGQPEPSHDTAAPELLTVSSEPSTDTRANYAASSEPSHHATQREPSHDTASPEPSSASPEPSSASPEPSSASPEPSEDATISTGGYTCKDMPLKFSETVFWVWKVCAAVGVPAWLIIVVYTALINHSALSQSQEIPNFHNSDLVFANEVRITSIVLGCVLFGEPIPLAAWFFVMGIFVCCLPFP